MKNRVINLVLWLAYLLAMLASLTHVAATLNTLELPGWHQSIGWVGAVSIDAGLAALAYAIQQRRRARRDVRGLWFGVILFASISGYANVLHALSVNPLALAQAVVFSGALPALVIYMGEIVSSDDAAAAEIAEREQRRKERQAERASETPATQSVAAQTLSDAVAKPSVYLCEVCEREFASRFALSAHARSHKNGHVAVSVPVEAPHEP